MIRRDWEFVWDQLKSTNAVCSYLERIADEPWELGDEPSRYYDLALADADARPGPIHPALADAGGRQVSAPLLPTRPAATDDQEAHFLIRTILEDMAVYSIAGRTEEERLRALAGLDSLPVSHRANIGRFLIDGLAAVSETPVEHREWRMRRLMSNPEDGRVPQLAYAACNAFDEMTRDFFRSWVELRHHEMHAISPTRPRS